MHAFVDAAVARFGRLDVIVNNAGYGMRGRVEETPAPTTARLMEVNYMGTVYGCQAALRVMRRQGRGVIINVSSIVGHRSLPGAAAYAATQGGPDQPHGVAAGRSCAGTGLARLLGPPHRHRHRVRRGGRPRSSGRHGGGSGPAADRPQRWPRRS